MKKKTASKKQTGDEVQKDLRLSLLKLKRLRDKKFDLKEKLSELNSQIEAVETPVFSTMQGLGFQSMKLNQSTFFLSSRPFFSVTDKQKALAWVKKSYPEVMSFNIQTLTSILKADFLEKKKKVPAFFKKYNKDSVGIRHATK